MLIAQLTDLHIKPEGRLAYGHVDTAACLQQALCALRALPQSPDLLLLTGDLADSGTPEEYRRLRGLLESGLADRPMPWLLVPGNHDSHDGLRAVFPDAPGADAGRWWQFAIQRDDWPLRIIGLDSVCPGESGGELCSDRLQWLSRQLRDGPHTPTLLALHHPPFATGIGHMDDIGLRGADRLEALLDKNAQIELVVSGHLHRCIRASVGGRAAMTAPSTAHAVELNLSRSAAAMFRLEPPGFMLHAWVGNRLVSHQAFTQQSAGPFPFYGDDGQLKL